MKNIVINMQAYMVLAKAISKASQVSRKALNKVNKLIRSKLLKFC